MKFTKQFEAVVQTKNLPPLYPGRQLIDLWSELAASDDVLMTYRGCNVVPVRARARILEKLHASHCGETKTLRHARSLYHWPGLAVDMSKYHSYVSILSRTAPCRSHIRQATGGV